jgi:HK97 family phage major capsid protein
MTKPLSNAELREVLGAPGSGELHDHPNPRALLLSEATIHRDALNALVNAADQRDNGEMLASESREFAGHKSSLDLIAAYQAELADSPQLRAGRAMKAAGLKGAYVGREQQTYSPEARHGYFHDLASATLRGDLEARQRLEQHGRQVENGVEYRDLNRTDGTGGAFVPPLWLMDQYISLARAGRVTANLVKQQPLPPGTDSLNIPKVSTGTATAIQTADNAAVQETDLADTTISAGVKTIAGQQDVAIQALEQSPISFDEIIFSDLVADLNTKVNLQVLSGSNGSGQVQGLLGTTGINTVTYTDTTPTVPELYSKLADAVQKVNTGRYLPPDSIVMHPRRWAWFLAALDTQNRPLVVPDASGPMNAVGNANVAAAEGYVGKIMGMDTYVDPSLPITNGAGTNEDAIVVMRASDLLLFESNIKTRVLPDVGSGTLTVRCQVYKYLAFTAARYPASISVVSGSGLSSPAF